MVFYNKNLKTNWQMEFGVTNESGILLSGDKVFTAYNNGIITCLDKEGKEKWHYETNGTIKANLLRDKDLIIAAALEGDLFTINSNNGDLVQVIGTGETISTNIAMIDIIYNDMKTKGIIFGTTVGNIYCYELYSLEMVWDGYLSDDKISSLIKANDDKIIFQDSKGKIFCINSSNGLLIWEWQAEVKNINPFFVSDIIIDGKSVYLADSDGLINCIDLLLGTESWKRKISSSGKVSLSTDKKYVITHTTKNEIAFLSRLKGKVQRKIKLRDEIKEKKLNFINADKDDIYLGFEHGILYRINNKKKVEKILFMGNSPLISFNKISDNKFIVSNLDGRVIQFSFR
jgi:outer membrane protein assembly factor BamB